MMAQKYNLGALDEEAKEVQRDEKKASKRAANESKSKMTSSFSSP